MRKRIDYLKDMLYYYEQSLPSSDGGSLDKKWVEQKIKHFKQEINKEQSKWEKQYTKINLYG